MWNVSLNILLLRSLMSVTLVLVVACGPAGSATGTPTPPPTWSETVAPSPTSSSPLHLDLDWQRAAFPPAPEGSAITGVAAAGLGFVGVGFDGGRRAMVWVSADGLAWKSVPHQTAFDDAVMSDVTSKGGLLVAVGRDVTSIEVDAAAAWTSHDGMTWQRAAKDGLEGGQMIRVIPGGPGFIAVGSAVAMDAAASWTSVDGTTWLRVPHRAAFDHAFIWSVAETPIGFVAAGWRRAPEPIAAVWTSMDGRDWRLAPQLPGGAGYEIRAVAMIRGRLLAAGSLVHGGAAATWTSADGQTWLRSSSPASFASAAITTFLPVSTDILALGGRATDAAAWTSAEGVSWSPLEDDVLEDAYVTSGATAGGIVVAVGATQQRIPGTGSFIGFATAWRGVPRSR